LPHPKRISTTLTSAVIRYQPPIYTKRLD